LGIHPASGGLGLDSQDSAGSTDHDVIDVPERKGDVADDAVLVGPMTGKDSGHFFFALGTKFGRSGSPEVDVDSMAHFIGDDPKSQGECDG
jgi:hypothetical protein